MSGTRLLAIVLFAALLLGLPSLAAAQTAADAYYDPDVMAAARAKLKASHGNQRNGLLIAERLEYSAANQEDALVWEAQGWYGTDRHKLWMKTEGKRVDGEGTEDAELQLLYSRAVTAFWDLQAGLRQDVEPDSARSHLVVGAQGLAPYWFEVDAALFLDDEGDLTARLEAEYDLFLTQRLILQPRLELNIAASDDHDLDRGRGVFDSVAELRLRYEWRREFAPYLGVSWGGDFGDTADRTRRQGADPRGFAIVAGLRFWF